MPGAFYRGCPHRRALPTARYHPCAARDAAAPHEAAPGTMTSLQTTQAYQVTYDYGKEGALVDALLGGDVPERRTPR